MSVYLHDIPLSQAPSRIWEAIRGLDLWRVLASLLRFVADSAFQTVATQLKRYDVTIRLKIILED